MAKIIIYEDKKRHYFVVRRIFPKKVSQLLWKPFASRKQAEEWCELRNLKYTNK